MRSVIVAAVGLALILKDAVLVSLWARALAARVAERRRPLVHAAAAVFGLAMSVPILLLAATGFRVGLPGGDLAPLTLYSYALYTWHIGGLLFFLALAAGSLVSTVARIPTGVARRLVRRYAGAVAPATPATPAARAAPAPAPAPAAADAGLTRREALVRAALAVPPLLLAGATAQSWSLRGRFDVRHVRVPIPGLPAGLDGMTIAHVSDLHIGRLIDAELLEPVVAAVTRLACDLVVVTGDTVDRSNDYLPPCIDAFRRMRAPLGLYACLGNHDRIDDAAVFVRSLRAADIHGQGPRTLLTDESVVIERGGEAFVLGGVDYGRGDERHRALVAKAFAAAPPRLPRILLAHHPHVFDAAAPAGVDLTLAGHTHGGQIVLFRRDEEAVLDPDTIARSGETLAPGALLFRYLEGLYERRGRFLFVSRGAGNWWPLRINCPAEVTRLTLVAAPPPAPTPP